MAKILLVDDSMFSRSMIRKIIKGVGHEVIEAANGREGLEMIMKEKPDLVITDLLMPEMDGIELLSAVKDQNLEVHIIVLSSNIQDTVRQECMDLGALRVFNKPPAKKELQDYLEENLINVGGLNVDTY